MTIRPFQMPASPLRLDERIVDASREVIEAEQWLQTNDWRDAVLGLASSDSQEFLRAVDAFRARVSLVERRARDAALEVALDGRVAELADVTVRWRARVWLAAGGGVVAGAALVGLIGAFF